MTQTTLNNACDASRCAKSRPLACRDSRLPPTPPALDPRPSTLDRVCSQLINFQLSTLLWPHPKAWAGLAAVWLVILAVNFATRETTPRNFARQVAPPSPEMLMVLRQQQLLLAELVERPEPPRRRPAQSHPAPAAQPAPGGNVNGLKRL